MVILSKQRFLCELFKSHDHYFKHKSITYNILQYNYKREEEEREWRAIKLPIADNDFRRDETNH